MENIAPINKEKKPRKLTHKQRAWVREYLKSNGNGVQSALKIYDTTDYQTASAISKENLQKPLIISEIESYFNKHGLSKYEFIGILTAKIKDHTLPDKDKARYMQMYIDTTPGTRAPIRSEESKDLHITLEHKQTQAIIDVTRQALKQAKE